VGIGYILGCLLSVLLWRFDRQVIYERINEIIKNKLKSAVVIEFTYIILVALICYLFSFVKIVEISNFITAFLVIDISNTERKNLKRKERVHFYDSISTISRSMICGFIAPLLFIAIGGNILGIAYSLVYNIWYCNEELNVFKYLCTIMNILPSIIGDIILYVVYIFRNKSVKVDFKGDFFKNLFIRPLLNIDIFAAFIESVNFYYYFDNSNTSFLKSYGHYNNKIDQSCIKDYLSIAYGTCLIIFICFFILVVNMAK